MDSAHQKPGNNRFREQKYRSGDFCPSPKHNLPPAAHTAIYGRPWQWNRPGQDAEGHLEQTLVQQQRHHSSHQYETTVSLAYRSQQWR